MHLHSTLEGRAGGFRLRGAAWAANFLSFRGFLYLIPVGAGGDGRYRVVECEGQSLWNLLEALGDEVTSIVGAPVRRLDAHAIGNRRGARRSRRKREDGADEPGFAGTAH
jgi:hypothetical protein